MDWRPGRTMYCKCAKLIKLQHHLYSYQRLRVNKFADWIFGIPNPIVLRFCSALLHTNKSRFPGYESRAFILICVKLIYFNTCRQFLLSKSWKLWK